MPKRPKSQQKGERPADLDMWLKDGSSIHYRARFAADTEVSIGRTDSKRALGFVVSRGDMRMDFVLNEDQVAELAAYLHHHPPLLKPLGPKPDQISIVAMLRFAAKPKKRRRA
jgi:hypothetical protein